METPGRTTDAAMFLFGLLAAFILEKLWPSSGDYTGYLAILIFVGMLFNQARNHAQNGRHSKSKQETE